MKTKLLKFAAIAAAGMAFAAATAAHAANPMFPKLFTADPSALVDNGMVYLYVGVDEATTKDKDYVMKEWRLYSSCDMKNWTDRGSPIKPSAFKWAIGKVDAWAADVTKR
ncbi:MAG TPA: glycoside hydrolase, partial [Duganella sp.]